MPSSNGQNTTSMMEFHVEEPQVDATEQIDKCILSDSSCPQVVHSCLVQTNNNHESHSQIVPTPQGIPAKLNLPLNVYSEYQHSSGVIDHIGYCSTPLWPHNDYSPPSSLESYPSLLSSSATNSYPNFPPLPSQTCYDSTPSLLSSFHCYYPPWKLLNDTNTTNQQLEHSTTGRDNSDPPGDENSSSSSSPTTLPNSPTMNDEDKVPEVVVNRSSEKIELINKLRMNSVNITKVQENLNALRIKEQELLEVANRPDGMESELSSHNQKYYSFAHKIYSENREKAAKHSSYQDQPIYKFPLYNQPHDTEVYHENQRKHMLFKERLIKHLQMEKNKTFKHKKFLIDKYNKEMASWQKRIEIEQLSESRKAVDAENRKIFTKMFPEINKKKKVSVEEMRKRSVAIPFLLSEKERKYVCINKNSKVEDPFEEHQNRTLHENIWSADEKKIFIEQFKKFCKKSLSSQELLQRFPTIASHIESKSTQDCVRFYYLNKFTDELKPLLQKKKPIKKKAGHSKK